MVGDGPGSRQARTDSSANRLRTRVPDDMYFRSIDAERPARAFRVSSLREVVA